MKEKITMSKITHVEKLDMYIEDLKALKYKDSNDSNAEIFDYLIKTHDYEAYADVMEEAHPTYKDYAEVPYVKDIKRLYIDFVKAFEEGSINKKELENDSNDFIDVLHFKMRTMDLFKVCNKRTFKVSQGLFDRLDITKSEDDLRYVKLPYPCIYIQFPKPIGHKNAENTSYEGAYVSQYEDNRLDIIPVYKTKYNVEKYKDTRLLFTALMPTSIKLDEKIKLNQVLDSYRNVNGNDFHEGDEYMITMLIKVLLYLCSINCDMQTITPDKNNKVNKKKLNKTMKTKLPYEYIGGSIKISNEYNPNNISSATGREIKTRFMVRGHYHKFWMNFNDEIANDKIIDIKDDKILVIKWVEPYWKGKEYADVVLKDYNVAL